MKTVSGFSKMSKEQKILWLASEVVCENVLTKEAGSLVALE